MSKVYCKKCGEFLLDHAGCYQRATDYRVMLEFIRDLAMPFPDRDDTREAIREAAVDILKQVGEMR